MTAKKTKTQPQPATVPELINTSPPGHLTATAQSIWAEIVPSRIKTPRVLVVLLAALEAFDRAGSAREAIKRDGMTTLSATGIPHVHPLLKVERDSRQQFVSVWKSLYLDKEPHEQSEYDKRMEEILRTDIAH